MSDEKNLNEENNESVNNEEQTPVETEETTAERQKKQPKHRLKQKKHRLKLKYRKQPKQRKLRRLPKKIQT